MVLNVQEKLQKKGIHAINKIMLILGEGGEGGTKEHLHCGNRTVL